MVKKLTNLNLILTEVPATTSVYSDRLFLWRPAYQAVSGKPDHA